MRTRAPGTIITALSLFAVLAVMIVMLLLPGSPLDGADQVILVVTGGDSPYSAVLGCYDRTGGEWRRSLACRAVVGKTGLAWGRGLHRMRDIPGGQPVKEEGDGAAPQGVFGLLHAYGYRPASALDIAFPYTMSTPDLICCDDPASDCYNRVVHIGDAGLDPDNPPSHEIMLREDDLYSYAVLVGHNTWDTVPGAGSCIFLHVWRGSDSPTVGCTAVEKTNMAAILGWLESGANPVLVQLTAENFRLFRDRWHLPGPPQVR